MTTPLTLQSLPDLGNNITTPNYARSDLTAGIMHVGVGNFHRAHQAVYLDRLFSQGLDHDWAILGAGIKSFDVIKRDQLAPQDWLTTVVELDPANLSARVTGAMIDFLPVEAGAISSALQGPEIRIVSLTVTEGGYYVDAATHGFDASHPEMVADATAAVPSSVFGILIDALAARRAAGIMPFTIMSCDNLPENGDVARQTILGLAALRDAELAAWISDNVAFPNSMVDCITPMTTPKEIVLVAEKFGLADQAPVICEPFRQWVMEDNFPAGRPALEKVGVEFVQDVKPHELMKLRILNGGHAAIAYVSQLLGYEFVHDAMRDADVLGWYRHLAKTEIIPTLTPIAGVSYSDYLDMCATRFANEAVADRTARLCQDGSNRQPKFILPTLTDALATGGPMDGLALEVALWCRYCGASELSLDDERADQLRAAAEASKTDPQAFLEQTDIFGTLADQPRFAQSFAAQLAPLWTGSIRDALRNFAAVGAKSE
ncbi:mannitol dehydrogenase [Sulfitobacter sp. SK012]|uniref:mannitol dehydrogenase family protein n=1 Tax=Sulfitobacter sp. SK012 TaxID=1389005 RepID=UPI000E0A0AF9|nr:mannitol dehydrogenase family protein [Sulfitobacter sp. SK012]AXI44701.1 mannitol dehydrogenase [Sulfitobacter sp. SK012]